MAQPIPRTCQGLGVPEPRRMMLPKPGFPPAHSVRKEIIPARPLERDVVINDVRRAARARGGRRAVRWLLHRRGAAERIIGRL
jgi:hypothetical protein